MFRRSAFRLSSEATAATTSPPACACPCYAQAFQYKYHIGGTVGVLSLAYLWRSSSHRRKLAEIERARSEKLKSVEDDVVKQSAQVQKLQKELKIAQTTIVGQELTLKKISEHLEKLSADLSSRAESLSSAIAKSDAKVKDVAMAADYELAEHRRHLAGLAASEAATRARFDNFEKKVQQCREVPHTATTVSTNESASQTGGAQETSPPS